MKRFYFSGVSSAKESTLLQDVQVSSVLVDPKDFDHSKKFDHVALDSGAYRFFKAGKTMAVNEWVDYLETSIGVDRLLTMDFIVQLDVIGDAAQTASNWSEIQAMRENIAWMQHIIPVWQWGDDLAVLDQLVEQSHLVGIGGLVRLMRDKDESMLKTVTEICQKHGPKLHLLGLNWLKAFQLLSPMIHSADTSK